MKLKLKGISFSKENKSATKGWRGISLLRHSGLRTSLVFLLMSFAFWFLQSLQNDVVRRLHIPLAYDTLSVSLGVSDRIPEFLELEVQDKALEHMRYALEGLDTIRLSIISEETGGDFIGISASSLRETLNRHLSSTAQILQQSIYELRIALYKRKSKMLPVRLEGEVKAQSGFVVREPVITPDSLLVYGEERVLDKLSEIVLPHQDIDRYRENVSLLVRPQLPSGVYTTTPDVRVEIEVEELTEQSFILPIAVLNKPKDYKLTPLPSTVSVSLTLPRSMYNSLKVEDLEVAIDYLSVAAYLDKDTSGATYQLPVILTRCPSWVVNHRLQPETVQYILEHQ